MCSWYIERRTDESVKLNKFWGQRSKTTVDYKIFTKFRTLISCTCAYGILRDLFENDILRPRLLRFRLESPTIFKGAFMNVKSKI